MVTPVSPSPFEKIIKEAGKVRTKGGYATLISILLFLCFVFSLMFSTGILQWALTIMSLLFLVGYAQYVFRHLKEKEDE
jgi:Ca2+/Na+ antiporter